MLKRKWNNKFYIGKEEVKLFAIYLPDLLLDKPQDYYFYFNPKNKKFEMNKDKTYAYLASQVFYDSNFIILAQSKKSDKIELIQDKTFLFEYFSDSLDEEDRQIFLENGQEEINKINSSFKNMKNILNLISKDSSNSTPEQIITKYLKDKYDEDLIFTVRPNGYGYLLEIHNYQRTLLPLFRFNFNKNWREKRIIRELNNLEDNQKYRNAINLSIESVTKNELEIAIDKAKEILSSHFDCKVINFVYNKIYNEIVITSRIKLNEETLIEIEFTKDLNLKLITKYINTKKQENVINGISYLKPSHFNESFAKINSKVNLAETDKWIPILDNL